MWQSLVEFHLVRSENSFLKRQKDSKKEKTIQQNWRPVTTSGDDYVEQLNEHIDNDDDDNKLVSLSIISASITFVKVAIILVISSSATAESPCDACVKSAILRGWVTFRLIFRFKGYFSCQYLRTIRWGNGYTTTLPLEVFTQRNFVADFIQLILNFIIKKTKYRFLSHPLEDYALRL